MGNIILPHFAAGGGWTTHVLLVNPTDQPLTGTIDMDTTYTYAVTPRSSTKITSAKSDLLRTEDQNSGMMTAGKQHKILQQREILMVVCEEDAASTNGAHEVHRVCVPGGSRRTGR